MDYLSHNIAVNLKRIRTMKGMSLDMAAEQTGVSKSMLHQIEKGDSNPSINVLGKIASGLRMEISELICAPAEESVKVTVSELVPTKEIVGQYSVRTCFPYEDNRTAEVYCINIEPGGEYISGGHGEKTREYICVLEGEVVIRVRDESHRINGDNVFRFESQYSHTYYNDTDSLARFVVFFVA